MRAGIVRVGVVIRLSAGLMAGQAAAGPAAIPAPPAPAPVAAQAPAAATPTPELTAFLAQADRWLLAGRDLPPELPRLLMPLAPADRLTAAAYLRRLGLLKGPALDLHLLLDAPQEPSV